MSKQVTISIAGVLRCCLASIGGDYVGEKKEENWKVFEDPEDGKTDTCEYCGREFTLVDRKWLPTEWKDRK